MAMWKSLQHMYMCGIRVERCRCRCMVRGTDVTASAHIIHSSTWMPCRSTRSWLPSASSCLTYTLSPASSPSSDDIRLRYRYLDLRLQHHILHMRSHMAHVTRTYMHQHAFTEVETPVLFKSTPEGERGWRGMRCVACCTCHVPVLHAMHVVVLHMACGMWHVACGMWQCCRVPCCQLHVPCHHQVPPNSSSPRVMRHASTPCHNRHNNTSSC